MCYELLMNDQLSLSLSARALFQFWRFFFFPKSLKKILCFLILRYSILPYRCLLYRYLCLFEKTLVTKRFFISRNHINRISDIFVIELLELEILYSYFFLFIFPFPFFLCDNQTVQNVFQYRV